MTQCVICTRDNLDGFACKDCARKLVEDLYWLAWLGAELQVTVTRQARLPTGVGGRHMGSPLGYHAGASAAYDALHNCLVGWVRDRGGNNMPRNTATAMALWLAHEPAWLRNLPYIEQLVTDVEHHTKKALELINPVADEQTYGVCGEEQPDGSSCDAHLYGEPRADWVRCRKCDTQHDARRRMVALERQLHTMFFRAATLARLLPRLTDRPVSASNVRNWAAEGRPIRTDRDGDEYVTYHCGDVIAVAASTPKRDRPGKKAS